MICLEFPLAILSLGWQGNDRLLRLDPQFDGGGGLEDAECERFGQVEIDAVFVMRQVAYGQILADGHLEISAASREDHSSLESRTPEEAARGNALDPLTQRVGIGIAHLEHGAGSGA